MHTEPLRLPGCLRIVPKIVRDSRGEFIKPFVESDYRELGLRTNFAEEYYSRSVRGVIRGMHFQSPPYDYFKLVSCLSGQIRDVIVDLRVGSPNFRKCEVLELKAADGFVLYLPPGIAHGFLALSETAIVSYKVTSIYAPAHDTGVRWDSLGIDWGIKAPILSDRDATLPVLAEIESPFKYQAEENSL
jgi:dTDP-4-dehydrorhamnose 3,5-epimerase